MVKRKAEYNEGPKARENFEDAMRAAFQIPKKRLRQSRSLTAALFDPK